MDFVQIFLNFVPEKLNLIILIMRKSRKNIYQVETKEVVDLETGEIGTIETVKKQKISFESEPFYMVFIDYVAPLYKLSNSTSKNVLA